MAAVLEGPNAIAVVRAMNGATRPHEAAPGSIRGDFALETAQNLVHASDSPENAAAEIELWFAARRAARVRARHRPLGARTGGVSRTGPGAPSDPPGVDQPLGAADPPTLGAGDVSTLGAADPSPTGSNVNAGSSGPVDGLGSDGVGRGVASGP